MDCSERMKGIKPSATLAISSKAKEMQAKGIDVISFSAGEPDFDTPGNIARSGCLAIESGFTRYTAASGIAELKKAVCEKMKVDSRLDVEPENVIISCGAKHALFNIFMAYLNPGDEVLLPSPYWLTYPIQISLAGGNTRYLKTMESDGFIPRIEDIENAVTEKTRAIIINSPGNPTGAVWPRKILEGVAELAIEKDLLLISDECYEKLVYGGKEHFSIASIGKETLERTVVVNAVSKTYAMTGWRIGYTVGPRHLIKAMGVLQSQVTSNPVSISQKAAVEALTGEQGELKKRNIAFDERRRKMLLLLNEVEGINCVEPYGAFYCFPNISKFLGKKIGDRKISSSVDLCDFLLSEAMVAVVPGASFGADDHIRLSYACSIADIERGIERISRALAAPRESALCNASSL